MKKIVALLLVLVSFNVLVAQKHTKRIEHIAFSPDNKMIATASSDKTVKVWDLEGKKLIKTFPVEEHAFYCTFSADSKEVITATWSKPDDLRNTTVKVWNIETGDEVRTISHEDTLSGQCAIDPESKYMFSQTLKGTGVLIDLATGKEIKKLGYFGRGSWGEDIRFNQDGTYLMRAYKKTVYYYDTKTWTPGEIDFEKDVMCSEASSEGNFMAFGGTVSTYTKTDNIFVYSAAMKEMKGFYDGEIIRDLSIYSGATTSLVSCSDNGVYLFDLNKMKKITDFKISKAEAAYSVRFCRDGKCFAVGGNAGSLIIYEPVKGKKLFEFN